MLRELQLPQEMRLRGKGMGYIKMYMLSVDQSTQGTKALIFDRSGRMVVRHDMPHRQIIDENGWVEHDLEEIWENTKEAVRSALKKAGIDQSHLLIPVQYIRQRRFRLIGLRQQIGK